MNKARIIGTFISLVVLLLLGGYFVLVERSEHEVEQRVNPNLGTAEFYTSASATTPQLAFWSAMRNGDLDTLFNVKVNYWKDIEELKMLVLAGRGDIWLGHIEGFALAARLGAPVALVAVTGWRKFYLVTRDQNVRSLEDLKGKEVPYTPPTSPALFVAQAISSNLQLQFPAFELKQLSFLLLNGRYSSAIAPEPLVTMLEEKIPDLRVVFNLEEEYGKRLGKPGRLPLAGIAVNKNTIGQDRAKVQEFLAALIRNTEELESNPERALSVLPSEFSKTVPNAVLKKSLARDLVLIEPGAAVEGEIRDYLAVVLPSLKNEKGELELPPSFFFRGE